MTQASSFRPLGAAAILLAALLPGTLVRAESAPHVHVRAALVSENRSITAGTPWWVGLHMAIEEGWHVNWRNPGDAGLAPTIKWDLPDGFSAGEIQWPHPETIVETELTSFGYHGEVLLPVQIYPPADLEPGTQVEIGAQADWIACRDVCVPEGAILKQTFAVDEGSPELDSIWLLRFERAKRMLPVVLPEWRATFTVESHQIEVALTAPEGAHGAIDNAFFAPYAADVIDHSAPQEWRPTVTGYTLRLVRPRNATGVPRRLAGLLLTGDWSGTGSANALEITATAAESGSSISPTVQGVLLGALLLGLAVWGLRRLG